MEQFVGCEGIGIGVNTLSADHTVTDPMLFEHVKHILQEVCPVHDHRLTSHPASILSRAHRSRGTYGKIDGRILPWSR
jgi:hypothetical protein